MFWILFTAPLMLIAFAAALIPVLVTMIRDERARHAARLSAPAALCDTTGNSADTDDADASQELLAA